MERNFEVKRQFCQELEHTLESLMERCPLGSKEEVLQLIEDYVMQVKRKRQYICFGHDIHFQALAFVNKQFQHPLFSLCPSPDAFVIAAVSKKFQLQMQTHFPKLRAQRTVALENFPNLINLELSLGKPTEFLPVLIWHQWKLETWTFWSSCCRWSRAGVVYHPDASELVSLWQSQFATGWYKYVRFTISSWECDAENPMWVETNQI